MQTKTEPRIADTNQEANRQTEIRPRIAEANYDFAEDSQYKPWFNQEQGKGK